MRKGSNGGYAGLQNRAKQNSSCFRLIHPGMYEYTPKYNTVLLLFKPFDACFNFCKTVIYNICSHLNEV